MSQVKLTCPKCQHQFEAKEADIYECPKCGSNVRAKEKKEELNFDATQRFKV